jgi:hypothetical protein
MSEMAKNLPRESWGKRLVHLYFLYNAWSVAGKRYWNRHGTKDDNRQQEDGEEAL